VGGTLTNVSAGRVGGWWGSALLGPEGISARLVWWVALWLGDVGCHPTELLAAGPVLCRGGGGCAVMVVVSLVVL